MALNKEGHRTKQDESQDPKGVKRKIKLVFKFELNARNKIAAINMLVVPGVTYSYGLVDWKLDEIQSLDKMTRKFQGPTLSVKGS